MVHLIYIKLSLKNSAENIDIALRKHFALQTSKLFVRAKNLEAKADSLEKFLI